MSPRRSTLPDYISETRTKFKNRRQAFFSKGIAVLNAVKVIFEGWDFVVGLLGPKLPKSTFFGGYVWGAMSPSSLGLLPNLNTSVDYTALSYWKLYKYSSQPLTPLQQTLWHFWLTNWQKIVQLWGAVSPKRGRKSKMCTVRILVNLVMCLTQYAELL